MNGPYPDEQPVESPTSSGDDSVLFADWPAEHIMIAERLRPLFATHGALYYKRSEPRRVAIGWPAEKAPFLLGTMTPQDDGVLLTLRVGKSSGLVGGGGEFKSDPHEDSGRLKLTSVESLPGDLPAHIAKAVSFMGRDRGAT